MVLENGNIRRATARNKHRKYEGNGCLSRATKKPGDSQFWSSLMDVKEVFYRFAKKKLGDGNNTRFWEDDKTLKEAYPRLYDL